MGIQNQTNELKALSDFIASDPDAMRKLAEDAPSVLADFGIALDDAAAKAMTAQLGDRPALAGNAQAAIIHIDA